VLGGILVCTLLAGVLNITPWAQLSRFQAQTGRDRQQDRCLPFEHFPFYSCSPVWSLTSSSFFYNRVAALKLAACWKRNVAVPLLQNTIVNQELLSHLTVVCYLYHEKEKALVGVPTPLAVLPLGNPSLLQNSSSHSQEQESSSQHVPVPAGSLPWRGYTQSPLLCHWKTLFFKGLCRRTGET